MWCYRWQGRLRSAVQDGAEVVAQTLHNARLGLPGSTVCGHDGDLRYGRVDLHRRILLGHCHVGDGRVWRLPAQLRLIKVVYHLLFIDWVHIFNIGPQRVRYVWYTLDMRIFVATIDIRSSKVCSSLCVLLVRYPIVARVLKNEIKVMSQFSGKLSSEKLNQIFNNDLFDRMPDLKR